MARITIFLSSRKRAMYIHRPHPKAMEQGISLIELLMFIVIISVAVVGIIQVLNLTNKMSADPQLRK